MAGDRNVRRLPDNGFQEMRVRNKYLAGFEPVRLIGWATAALVTAASVIEQVTDSYDEDTGWMGLGFGIVVAVSTELQRRRVTPVKALDASNIVAVSTAAPPRRQQ